MVTGSPRKEKRSHLLEIVVFGLVILLLGGGTYWRNRLWNDEIALWTDCVKKSPNKARPYANLSMAFLDGGAYDKAVDYGRKAVQIDPSYASAYYTLCLAYQKIEDFRQAIAMGEKALALDPNYHEALYALGMIYFQDRQFSASAEAFKKLLKIYPYFPEAHHLLGIVYAAQKQFDQAVSEFEGEIRINPYHVLAHLNLGQIYWYEFKNRDKALHHLKTALALDQFLPNRSEVQRLVRLLEESPS